MFKSFIGSISFAFIFTCSILLFSYLTRWLFKTYVGEVLYIYGKSGKKYKVLKRPKESRYTAILRLKTKVFNGENKVQQK